MGRSLNTKHILSTSRELYMSSVPGWLMISSGIRLSKNRLGIIALGNPVLNQPV